MNLFCFRKAFGKSHQLCLKEKNIPFNNLHSYTYSWSYIFYECIYYRYHLYKYTFIKSKRKNVYLSVHLYVEGVCVCVCVRTTELCSEGKVYSCSKQQLWFILVPNSQHKILHTERCNEAV